MVVSPPGERIVVVSPHLDDGVLSLGASIASWSRTGATVELLTVFGCDPDSAAPVGGWDRRGGFATEGESARARREEDRRACALIGATPVWLPFGSVDYERHGDEGDVRRAVTDAAAGADLALVPGFPLTHPDHAWLVKTLTVGKIDSRRIALYAEQPYTRRVGAEPHVPAWVSGAVGGVSAFEPVPAQPRDRIAKWRAIRRYRSQLPMLGMRRSLRRGPRRYALAPEWVAWAGD
jgi:LmbE family N-acetylglucosaminyl deacetylase